LPDMSSELMVSAQGPEAVIPPEEILQPARPRWLESLARLGRRKPSLVAAIILLVIIAVSIAAPLIAPYDPQEMHADSLLAPPSARFLFGTDEEGQDLLSRVLYAGRSSMALAGASVLCAMVVGTILGLASGYGGALLDALIMRFMDALISFPWLLMAILIVTVLGPGLPNTVLAIAVIGIPSVARMTRATVLVEKEKDYVLAARVVGGSDLQIVVRHILPNIMPSTLLVASLTAANAILTEATIGFIGLGVQPPYSSWGLLLRRGYSHFVLAPWYISSTAIVVVLTIWSLNTLGDGLRDALDPRLRGIV